MDLFPLANSLRVAAASTVVVFLLGIALANVVSRAPRVVCGLADVVLTLPLVLPPTVVGFLLLMLLGPRRPLGAWALSALGVRLTMVWYAAVFATVVVSFPLMYRTARGAFESFDQTLADAARTLGRSNEWVFWRVKMPCCRQGIVAGAVWANTAPRPWCAATCPAPPRRYPPRCTSCGARATTPARSRGCS